MAVADLVKGSRTLTIEGIEAPTANAKGVARGSQIRPCAEIIKDASLLSHPRQSKEHHRDKPKEYRTFERRDDPIGMMIHYVCSPHLLGRAVGAAPLTFPLTTD